MSVFITFWKINYIIRLLYWQQKKITKSFCLVGTIHFSFFHISVKVNRRFCRCHEEIGFSLKIRHIRLWSLHLRRWKFGINSYFKLFYHRQWSKFCRQIIPKWNIFFRYCFQNLYEEGKVFHYKTRMESLSA